MKLQLTKLRKIIMQYAYLVKFRHDITCLSICNHMQLHIIAYIISKQLLL